MVEKEEKKQKKVLAVAELPVETIRSYKDEKGNEYELILNQEAITEILETVREIKKVIK